jgi:hypothetical protein
LRHPPGHSRVTDTRHQGGARRTRTDTEDRQFEFSRISKN